VIDMANPSIAVRVSGINELEEYGKALTNRTKNLSILEFAQYLKQEADKNLHEGNKGWPNPRSSPIKFYTRTKANSAGSAIVMYAVGFGSDGTQYAPIQEDGYPDSRFSNSFKKVLKAGKWPKGGIIGPMKFMTPDGRWVSKYQVGAIPAKHFMQKTQEWADTAFPRYIEAKVEDAIRR